MNWKYIKGGERDFVGAPGWCKQVSLCEGDGNRCFDENIHGRQQPDDKFQWEGGRQASIKESANVDFKGAKIIA